SIEKPLPLQPKSQKTDESAAGAVDGRSKKIPRPVLGVKKDKTLGGRKPLGEDDFVVTATKIPRVPTEFEMDAGTGMKPPPLEAPRSGLIEKEMGSEQIGASTEEFKVNIRTQKLKI